MESEGFSETAGPLKGGASPVAPVGEGGPGLGGVVNPRPSRMWVSYSLASESRGPGEGCPGSAPRFIFTRPWNDGIGVLWESSIPFYFMVLSRRSLA